MSIGVIKCIFFFVSLTDMSTFFPTTAIMNTYNTTTVALLLPLLLSLLIRLLLLFSTSTASSTKTLTLLIDITVLLRAVQEVLYPKSPGENRTFLYTSTISWLLRTEGVVPNPYHTQQLHDS